MNKEDIEELIFDIEECLAHGFEKQSWGEFIILYKRVLTANLSILKEHVRRDDK